MAYKRSNSRLYTNQDQSPEASPMYLRILCPRYLTTSYSFPYLLTSFIVIDEKREVLVADYSIGFAFFECFYKVKKKQIELFEGNA